MATFYFSDKPLGASTAYARIAGMIGKLVAPRHTESLKYYRDTKPKVDWEVMLLVGVVVGAFLAAWCGGRAHRRVAPPMWAARFGADSIALRLAVAFAGGAAHGLRRADGRRVHERARDQRHAPAIRRVVDRGRMLFRRRDRDRDAHVPRVTGL